MNGGLYTQTSLDSMKHLKRFNENVEDDLDIEYIKHCFADLSDDPECGLEYEMNDRNDPHFEEKYVEFVDISIDVPRLTKGGSIEKMVENSERIALVVKSVDIAVKRLKDEYPSYTIVLDYIEDDVDKPNNYFMINITK
jgi:hypothetical protein